MKQILISLGIGILVGAGGTVGAYFYFWKAPVPTERIKYIDRIQKVIENELVPIGGDTVRYTNLYTNCHELSVQVSYLTNQINHLTGIADRPRFMVGGCYLNRPGIPVGLSAGVELANFVIIGTIGIQTNWQPDLAKVDLLWRF